MKRPNPTAGMRHVALWVNNFEACENFYIDLLGMEAEWRPDPDNLYMCSGCDNVALHRSDRDMSAAQHLDHIGFILKTMDDVDEWYEFLRSHDVNVFKEVIRKNSVFAEEFIKCFSKNNIHTFGQFVTLTQKNMEGRIAEALLYLKNEVFKNGAIKHITKQEIADLTGLTKESTIRVMKDFRNETVLEEVGKEIIILDEAGLQKYADLG